MVGRILAYRQTHAGAVGTETRLLRKLDMLNRATAHKDLQAPPANHLHALSGGREGQWAISVSGAWRLCFRFEAGDIFDLELVQYH